VCLKITKCSEDMIRIGKQGVRVKGQRVFHGPLVKTLKLAKINKFKF
jgi:hypothetical protein